MKLWFLAMAALVTVCHGQTDAETDFDAKVRNIWKNEILDDLKDATAIVVCEFKAPGGYTITRVIRGGDNVKVGQFWNSFGTSEKQHNPPLLTWQKTTDHIGDGPSDTVLSSYYQLDPTGKSITQTWTLFPEGSENPDPPLLISLAEIEEALRQSSGKDSD